MLDLLRTRHIRASFGLTGTWVEDNPALALQIVAEDHLVINHSYDHASFTGFSTGDDALSRAERVDQLRRAEEAIRNITGADPRPFFRPPYGDLDDSLLSDASGAGYPVIVMWTVDSLGWKGTDPAAVAERCLDAAAPGNIYLFHVGSASTDVLALPAIVDGLIAGGYRFATIDEFVAD
jgi:peptidoglycan/xylan/chitin deacetylase (PgdA/CDA1 family)